MNDSEGTIGRRLLSFGMRALGITETTPPARKVDPTSAGALAAGMEAGSVAARGLEEAVVAARGLEEAVARATVAAARVYEARLRSAMELAPDEDRPALGLMIRRAARRRIANQRVADVLAAEPVDLETMEAPPPPSREPYDYYRDDLNFDAGRERQG